MSDRLVITPAELGTIGVKTVQQLHDSRDRLMPILLPGMDGYFMPLEPGSLTIVQAQTSNGKSWFMRRWMERMVKFLKWNNRNEILVWIDTEITADYIAMSNVMRQSGTSYDQIVSPTGGIHMQSLMKAAADIAGIPVYTIATRLGNDGSEVHLSNIRKGLSMLQDGRVDGEKHVIAGVFVDYLQSLPVDPVVQRSPLENQRRLQVARDVDQCRIMGAKFGAPVVLGVQAKQTLEPSEASRKLGLPGMYDGQETANIAQRADRIISLSVAARNFGKGQTLDYHGQSFTVTDGLMFARVLKQRGDDLPSGAVFAYQMHRASDPMDALVNLWSES